MEQLFQFALHVIALHHLQALVNDLLPHHHFFVIRYDLYNSISLC
jgi:hypothetical protein